MKQEKAKYEKMEAEVAEVQVEKGYCSSCTDYDFPPMPFDPPHHHGGGHHRHGC